MSGRERWNDGDKVESTTHKVRGVVVKGGEYVRWDADTFSVDHRDQAEAFKGAVRVEGGRS